MCPAELLLYRSNLLGSDRRITNFGGGNTSAKLRGKDPLTGQEVDVLWVKGSGGDLGTMKLEGFSTLYLEKLWALPELYRGREDEDRMVGLYPHCTFSLNPRAPSIDTPLHAYTVSAGSPERRVGAANHVREGQGRSARPRLHRGDQCATSIDACH